MFDTPTYLGSVLPALIQAAAPKSAIPEAVVQFLVADRDDSNFVYRLRPDGVSVESGISDTVDLTLAFIAEDVERFAQHRLDVAASVRSRRLKVYGNPDLLSWLAEHLAA